ncbi:MAG: carboxypeptidase regulatory-like domain-containing protein, partial [Roseiflexaceae bacterium]
TALSVPHPIHTKREMQVTSNIGKRFNALLMLLGLVFGVAPLRPSFAQDSFIATLQHDLVFAAQQLTETAGSLSPTSYPFATNPSGTWESTRASNWTSGFFPGSLWLLYQHTGEGVWLARAQQWQRALESQKTRTDTHDLGFMIFNSFGNGYRITNNDSYRQVVLTAASSLSKRYNPVVGCIKSWDGGATDFKVIIDNMMNLELLFWAAKHGGDPAWYNMAVSHALKTREQHVRSDGSTYHVVNYDPNSGTVQSKETAQGYSAASTWSRGQAWAIYGFTMTYRETGDTRFLDTARATADYFITHLPVDAVPYWDFQAPNIPNEPRDSSAAAIAASGLLELSRLEPNATRGQYYRDTAKTILLSLSSRTYLAEGTSNHAILLHGTGNKPKGSSDTGLIWGDYYFLEALLRYTDTDTDQGVLVGQVIDHTSGAGIAGATITNQEGTTTSDASGAYRVGNIAAGTQTISATAPGYERAEQTVIIPSSATLTVTFVLTPELGVIEGAVYDRVTGHAISLATVSYTGGMTVTNALGRYRLAQVPTGIYHISVSARGYIKDSQEAIIRPGTDALVNFMLTSDLNIQLTVPRLWIALAKR